MGKMRAYNRDHFPLPEVGPYWCKLNRYKYELSSRESTNEGEGKGER